MRLHTALLALALGSAAVRGQTRVALSSQAKDIDLTGAAATLPVKAGTELPGTCRSAELFFKTDAAPGANLYGCTATNTWTQQGGVAQSAQLSTLGVERASSQMLSIGAGCSVSTPCNVRFGNTVYSIQSGATATLSSGSGLAFVYVSSAGVLTVGHSLSVACSGGCVSQAGVTAFPEDSIPLFAWTATSGTWDVAGAVDFRAFLSTKKTLAGSGLMTTEASGHTTVAIDATVVPMRVGVPASSSSACSTGTWALDSSFFFVCVATNTWARTGIASW